MKKTHIKLEIGVIVHQDFKDEAHEILAEARNKLSSKTKEWNKDGISIHGVNSKPINFDEDE